MPFTPRRERTSLFPGGFGLRLVAMLSALALIGATIYTLRSQYLAALAAQRAERMRSPEPERDPKAPWTETVVSGPSDEDPAEREDARRFFEVIDDGQKLLAVDMPAYWKFVKWSRSASTEELEKRARRDVPFIKLAERPALHRGELIRLKLDVKRVLKYSDAEIPENSMGVKSLYELWGVTDDSMDYPLSIIVNEIPPGIPVGTEVAAQVVFVGYFLKLYDYESAGGKHRRAPLLIGRVRRTGGNVNPQIGVARSTGLTAMLIGGGVLICVVVLLVSLYRMTRGGRRSRVSLTSLSPHGSVDIESWLERGTVDDPENTPTAADRYSPAVATNGKAHHQNGESNGESGDHSD